MFHLSYFLVQGHEVSKIWNALRQQHIETRKKTIEFAHSIGAFKVLINDIGEAKYFAFSEAEGIPKGFTSPVSYNDQLYYMFTEFPANEEEKNILDKIITFNGSIANSVLDLKSILDEQGFLHTLNYKDKNNKNDVFPIYIDSNTHAKPIWTSPTGAIYICAIDPNDVIKSLQTKGFITEISSWEVPEGYKKISKKEYDFRIAKELFESEEE